MDDQKPPVGFHLEEDLQGRIDNLAMSPSYDNTLIPLFEAVMNSIHSVQERFGEDEWTTKGWIHVAVHTSDEGAPHSFTVEDNGVGLDEKNFKSFRTYDSRYKVKKGGKGVGRLTWLKVFQRVKAQSIYHDGSSFRERSFDFLLDNDQAFHNYIDRVHDTADDNKTTIHLSGLKPGYDACCPKRIETITHKLVAHFLPFLLGDVCPDIYVSADDEDYSLRQIIKDHTHNLKTQDYKVDEIGDFHIKHLLLSKHLLEKGTEHTVYLAAHDRIVQDHGINNQTGLDTAFEFNENAVFYVGVVSCDYLDMAVTQERNNFDIPKKTLKEITKAAEEKAKEYLKDQIDLVIKRKAETIERVIANFPRYRYLVKDKTEMAKRLPLNRKTEEDIYREMSVYDYRKNREVRGEIKSLVAAELSQDGDVAFDEAMANLMERIGEQEKSSLAEYVGKRKLIIDILQSRLGYEDPEKKRKYTEEAVHQIICPLKVDSGDITYGQHNLWLLDDRLAYYDYWASDQNIKKYAESSDCADRPDLVLFQGSNLLRREGTDQPVVIVEFKRPARKEYNDDENPIKQVYDYIRELRDNKITDSEGNLITEIGQNTPFFCYLVCDITPRLMSTLEDYDISQELPGGRGYFGFNKKRGAYIEVLQYNQIVKDAKLRHEAFFAKLGIN